MKRPILTISLALAILGAIVALVAFIGVWPWAFLFGASAALIAGTNACYAWRYEQPRSSQ